MALTRWSGEAQEGTLMLRNMAGALKGLVGILQKLLYQRCLRHSQSCSPRENGEETHQRREQLSQSQVLAHSLIALRLASTLLVHSRIRRHHRLRQPIALARYVRPFPHRPVHVGRSAAPRRGMPAKSFVTGSTVEDIASGMTGCTSRRTVIAGATMVIEEEEGGREGTGPRADMQKEIATGP